MSLSAGSLIGDLGLNIDPFTKGMVQAGAIANIFPSVVTNFLAAPLLGWVSLAKTAAQGVGSAIESGFEYVKNAFFDVAESAHTLGIEADKAGVSTKFLAHVGAAAKAVNLPIEEVAHSMAFLSRNAADAAQGNEQTMMSFARLGITVYDATGHIKDTEGLFTEVADAISGLSSPAEQARAAMDLLSRGGIEMLPLLKKGSTGVDETAARMKAASGGMADDLVGISDKVVEMEQVWDASWTGIKRAVATPFLRFAAAHAQQFEGIMNRVAGGVRAGIGFAFQFIEAHSGQVAAAVAAAASYASRGLHVAWDAVQEGIQYAKKLWADWQPLIAWVKGEASKVVGETLPHAFAAIKPYALQARDIFMELLDIGKQVSNWVTTEAVPAIGDALRQAFAALQPAIAKVGPLLHEFLDYLKEAYTWVAHYISPALEKFGQIAKPVVGFWIAELKVLGKFLEWIFDKATTVLHAFNQAAHALNLSTAPALTTRPPPAPSGVAVGLAASGGVGLHAYGVPATLSNLGNDLASSHPRPRAAPAITVNAKFDPIDTDTASSEIAAKLRPAIQEAARRQKEQYDRAGDAGGVGGAL